MKKDNLILIFFPLKIEFAEQKYIRLDRIIVNRVHTKREFVRCVAKNYSTLRTTNKAQLKDIYKEKITIEKLKLKATNQIQKNFTAR